MKKIGIMLSAILIIGAFCGVVSAAELDKATLSKNIATSMKARNVDVNVDIEVVKKLDAPAGFYFVKLTFFDKANPTAAAGQQYVFTDGNFIIQDILRASDMGSISKDLTYQYSYKEIDTKGLTPIFGKQGAKNVIIEVTDFQCPFCIQANKYLHDKLKNRNDVVIYIVHFPLRDIHPKADIMAKIFEAGAMLNKNFANDLFADANTKLGDVELIAKYAKLSGNDKKFRELLTSKEVTDKIKHSEQLAAKLEVRSTPTLFFNGKLVAGYDEQLMDSAVKDFK